MREIMPTIIAALLLAAVPATADYGGKGDWELGLYGGYGWLDDYGEFHPENGPLVGARVGYFITPAWSVEPSVQRLFSETDIPDSLGLPNDDMTLSSLRLNVLYSFAHGEDVRPFLTAGVGCEKVDFNRYGNRSDVGFNAGGGARWFLSPNFNLRLDGRVVRTNVDGDIDEAQNNVEATFGIGWAFGGESRRGVAAATPIRDRDSDGDGIYDRYDLCPDTPRGVKVDRTGCPPPTTKTPLTKILQEREAVVLEGVEFGHDEDALRSESLTTLDEVAASLKDWPDVRLEVQGHCSEPGTEEYNVELSKRRAEAVKAYLVSQGIASSRLVARGYGKTRMIANNSTEAGMQLNRRVELHVIK